MNKSDITRDYCMLRGPLARKGYDWWWHSFTAERVDTGPSCRMVNAGFRGREKGRLHESHMTGHLVDEAATGSVGARRAFPAVPGGLLLLCPSIFKEHFCEESHVIHRCTTG